MNWQSTSVLFPLESRIDKKRLSITTTLPSGLIVTLIVNAPIPEPFSTHECCLCYCVMLRITPTYVWKTPWSQMRQDQNVEAAPAACVVCVPFPNHSEDTLPTHTGNDEGRHATENLHVKVTQQLQNQTAKYCIQRCSLGKINTWATWLGPSQRSGLRMHTHTTLFLCTEEVHFQFIEIQVWNYTSCGV